LFSIFYLIFYFYQIFFRHDTKEDNYNVKNKMNNLRNNQAISSVDIYGGEDYGMNFYSNNFFLFLFL
jgi:hypothetical protein